MSVTESSAAIIGPYRYELHRRWGDGLPVMWIMLNPSTADAVQDDPTIRRCISFSRRWGYGAMVVCNLYSYRATNPLKLKDAHDPRGPLTEATLRYWMDQSPLIVAAWGAFAVPMARKGHERIRVEDIAAEKGHALWCLGLTETGQPRHPLYVRQDQELERWP